MHERGGEGEQRSILYVRNLGADTLYTKKRTKFCKVGKEIYLQEIKLHCLVVTKEIVQ